MDSEAKSEFNLGKIAKDDAVPISNHIKEAGVEVLVNFKETFLLTVYKLCAFLVSIVFVPVLSVV